ncbi:FG-GAP-like repeat-containing protein [Dactylosporangium matsuzakiense]|uniref:PKD domain-containing protein n=1 Tax=Dactylosporangium matsuzakiense TaxID=53360 RepID=A0A9W6KHD4_9ACTN|nr:FG-GAP-like repeat-containing protein [Dactylosporangium matsuzakiense]UWZ42495.1 right-handed parallel beta-helix repeat-containing protein [Dactylosporangium matsuzakiense]GLL00589.1 hypothetical protein GCM10017581_023300 [Dactylosporangium matsuzakiense]
MSRHLRTGVAIVIVAAGAVLVAGAGTAFADTPGPLYVNNTSGSNCTDSGTGTLTRPYCTIGAAMAVVVPGQTVNVTGTYSEHVTITRSGTAGQPITLQRLDSRPAQLNGAAAGITIAGQHDIAVNRLTVYNVSNGPGVDVSDSTRITLQTVSVTAANTAAVVGIRLAAVTDSSLLGVRVGGGQLTTGLNLDAATSGVLVKSAILGSGVAAGSKVVDIAGSANTVVNSTVGGGAVAGIALEPGAHDNIVANNYVYSGRGLGIVNTGATGTAITNNSVTDNCAGGIRVSGASSGVSVQNNFSDANGPTLSGCDTSITNAAQIGLYDGAAGTTVVDYNCVDSSSSPLYAWNTPMGLAAFRTASGQAAHDRECPTNAGALDSANSAAPGYQSTDTQGRPRKDDPATPDTGAGPVTYADRGNTEYIKGPDARLAVTANQHTLSITADASATVPGWAPVVSYTFDFEDGTTVTQATPIVTHQYAKPSEHVVSLTVTDANGIVGTTSAYTQLWTAARMKVDFNGDGRTDIAGLDAGSNMKLYPGDGTGKLTGTGTPMWATGGLWAGFKHIVAGDFNNDGSTDIAGIDANNDLKLYTGNGAGKLTGTGTPMWATGGLWAGFKLLT